jgi:hypothetical protein
MAVVIGGVSTLSDLLRECFLNQFVANFSMRRMLAM